jgi:hypothetical protein
VEGRRDGDVRRGREKISPPTQTREPPGRCWGDPP